MLKKFVIILLSVFMFSLSAYAGSDSELVLSEKEKPKNIKGEIELPPEDFATILKKFMQTRKS